MVLADRGVGDKHAPQAVYVIDLVGPQPDLDLAVVLEEAVLDDRRVAQEKDVAERRVRQPFVHPALGAVLVGLLAVGLKQVVLQPEVEPGGVLALAAGLLKDPVILRHHEEQ